MVLDVIKDYGPSFSPIVIAVSAAIAVHSIRSAARTARMRATLDMIEKAESTEHYRNMQEVFSAYRRNSDLVLLNAPSDPKLERDRDLVVGYLNHYELVAIGIAKKALDADYYGAWMKGPLVRDWNAAAEFVQRERWKWDPSADRWIYRSSVWANYGALARRWSIDAVKLTRDHTPPPEEPKGVGDEPFPKTSAETPMFG